MMATSNNGIDMMNSMGMGLCLGGEKKIDADVNIIRQPISELVGKVKQFWDIYDYGNALSLLDHLTQGLLKLRNKTIKGERQDLSEEIEKWLERSVQLWKLFFVDWPASVEQRLGQLNIS